MWHNERQLPQPVFSVTQPCSFLSPDSALFFFPKSQDFIQRVNVTGSSSHHYSCSQGPNWYLLSSSSATQSRCPSLFANTSAGLHCFLGGVAYIHIPKGSEFLLSFWTEVATVPIDTYQAWSSRQDMTCWMPESQTYSFCPATFIAYQQLQFLSRQGQLLLIKIAHVGHWEWWCKGPILLPPTDSWTHIL